MDVFEFAKKMEMDGKKLYEGQLTEETNEGLKEILRMLIAQEQHHYDVLDEIEKSGKYKNYKNASFKGVKSIFIGMKKQLADVPKDHVKFYHKILEIEKRSEEFYRKHAGEQNGEIQEILLRLAKEEEGHVVIIENVIEFINKPKTWVEDAEFNHLGEY
jgi:rubrerythrin